MTWKKRTIFYVMIVIAIAVYYNVYFRMLNTHAYRDGYEQGAHHTLLHLQATGYLPSMAWRNNHLNNDIQSPEELLEISPEITFISKDPCITLGR